MTWWQQVITALTGGLLVTTGMIIGAWLTRRRSLPDRYRLP
jgi:hypothetical protein